MLQPWRLSQAIVLPRSLLGGGAAVVSLLVSTFYVLALVEKNIKSAQELWAKTVTEPALLLPLMIVIFCLLVATWSAFWLRESKQPFRYTCSLGSFEPMADGASDAIKTWMTWMPHDMTRLLNERVQRFFFTGHPKPGQAGQDATAKEDDGAEADVHIRAYWVVREVKDSSSGMREIEVMPRVRLGPKGSPEVMAQQATVFTLNVDNRAAYEELLEQVYHCVVTEVYRQLEKDVRNKIKLLPTARYRAIALLHEADDYTRSNTLHAYEEAEKLYREAAVLADPEWDVPRTTRLPQVLRAARCAIHRARTAVRRFESKYHPNVQAMDLLGARALSGAARTLVFTRILSAIVGKATGAAFEAPSLASTAVAEIEALSPDVPDYAEALFDAYVTRALGRVNLGDYRSATDDLDAARRVLPDRVNDDAVFILARALVAPEARTRLGFLRRAVDRAPRFEVAQFSLAHESESMWRSRPTFEPELAKVVIDEYERLLRLNPANLGGCANAGYVCWLLGDLIGARKFFEMGLRFANTRKDLFASELDYGLARVDAENGRFVDAYRHYLAAVSVLALGFQGGDFRWYYFQPMSDDAERRFGEYYLAVRGHLRMVDRSNAELVRLSRSIHAFVLNDLGEAYAVGYDARRRRLALAALKRARRLNPAFLLPCGTLADLDSEKRQQYLEEGLALEPAWPAGGLALANYHAAEIRDLRRISRQLREAPAQAARLRRRIARVIFQRVFLFWRRAALANEMDECRQELAALERKIVADEAELQSGLEAGRQQREKALRYIRPLLPHKWLWVRGQLNFSVLCARSGDRRLIRELSQLNADALYNAVRTYLYDEDNTERTIRAFEQLRQFWPGNPYLLVDLLDVKRTRMNDDALRAIVDETLLTNPAAILYLVERRIPVTNKQLFDCDRAALLTRGEYREVREMTFRREYLYRDVALMRETAEEAEEVFYHATKVFEGGWPLAELSQRLRKRAVMQNDPALVSGAMRAAREAVRREASNRAFAAELAKAEWLRQFGVQAQRLVDRPARLAIRLSAAVMLDEEEKLSLQATCNAFQPPLPAPDVAGNALLAGRSYAVLIDGRAVETVILEEAEPVLDSLERALSRLVRRHGSAFLGLDDVQQWLNDDTGDLGDLGDRLRAERLLPHITRVFRALHSEGIELQRPDRIVRAFRDAWAPGRTLTEVCEDVRNHAEVRRRMVWPRPERRRIVRLGPNAEQSVRSGLAAGGGAILALDPDVAVRLRDVVASSFGVVADDDDPVLVCTAELRPWVRQLVENDVTRLVVASERQLSPDDPPYTLIADDAGAPAQNGRTP
ncbi:MAG TPA: FHIPEP family type III secretion protein [Thermoanaerobaculia bacterium]|nr:FHIPEP family type III secretion protein [Thermoanaerobaculia bacterium]